MSVNTTSSQYLAIHSNNLKTPLSVMVASADAYFNDKDEKWVRNIKSEYYKYY